MDKTQLTKDFIKLVGKHMETKEDWDCGKKKYHRVRNFLVSYDVKKLVEK
jgi:hypothetical protein